MLRQLHTLDSLFLHLDSKNTQMDITPVYIYDPSTAKGGKLSYKQILNHLNNSIKQLPILRCRLERLPFDMDNPYLAEDPHFDIENHVRHITLAAPGSWQQLCQQVADFHARPLDTRRPLWDIQVINGLGDIDGLPKGCLVLAMKMHHAIADGHTAVEITTKMHDEGLAQLRKLPATTQPHYQAPDLLSKMSRVLSNNMRHAANLVNPLLKAGPKVGLKLMGAMLKPMGTLSKAPVKTRFNQPISTDRTWDCTSFSLQEIKQVSQLIPGATINDVVLTVVAGALRQYFESKGDSLEHCLRALAPINVRQEQEHHQAGNEVAMFFPDLPVNIADPVDRMFAVVQSTHNAKKIAEDLGSRDLSDFTKNIPPAYVSYLEMLSNLNSTIGNLINHVGHTVVTNVPGPTHELHFSGARLVNLTGVLLISDGMGLNHVINSYAGKLNISAISCPKLLPDIEFYMQCLQDSFAQLQLSAQQRYQQALPVEKKDAKPAAKKKPVKRAVKRVPKAAVVSSKSEPKRPPAKKAKAKESAKPKPAVAQTATSKPTMPKATDAKASTSKPANPKPVVAKTPTSKVTGTKASMSKPASPKAVAKAESELKSAM